MEALAYWKAATADKAGFLERVVALLAESDVKYCVIGGQAVNAFVEPVVSLDLDLAVATADVDSAENLLRRHFRAERFPHSVNVSMPGSDLRIPARRASRRQKDLADISRLLGAYPELRTRVPDDVLSRLI